MRLPLIKGGKIDGRAEWKDALPLNMVGFVQEVDGDYYYMRTLDGLKSFATAEGEDRGGIWSERFSSHVRLSGTTLIEVDEFGAVTDVSGGTEISGTGQARFAGSFNTIAIVADGELYLYDPDAADEDDLLQIVTKPEGAGDFLDVCYIDGYYLVVDSENVWNTDLSDEYTISAINYAGSDFAPDEIVGCAKSTDNKLLIFNRYNVERFYNAAGEQFPFSRITNAAIPIGALSANAKVSVGDGSWVVFGGSKEYSPSFYMFTSTYTKISTGAIDSILETYNDYELKLIKLEFRDVRDQRLVICHLPRHTLVYDVTMSAVLSSAIWYEWQTDGGPWRGINGVYDPRSVDDSASAWVYGDKDDSRLGKLDTTICTQYDEGIQWKLFTPMVVVGGTIASLEVLTTPGHSVVEDPNRIGISTSRDGVLFGPEVLINAGQTGQYQHRLIALRVGDYPLWFSAVIRGYSETVTSLAALNIETSLT